MIFSKKKIVVHAEIKYLNLWSYLISLRGSLSFLSEISLERKTAEGFQRTLEVMCSSKVENREHTLCSLLLNLVLQYYKTF